MRARAELIAGPALRPGGACRLTRRRDAAPIAWRSTPSGVFIVGTAATPVHDDEVEIDLRVEDRAALAVRSAAATVAWRGHSTTSRVLVSVGADARLDWHPEPLIATAGCHHRQIVRVALQPSSRLRWVEEVILGRHDERPGWLDLRLDLDVGELPLLRHQLRLGPGVAGWAGPAVLGAARCVGLVLDAGPHVTCSEPQARSGSSAVLHLDGPGRLTVAVASDLSALRRTLACLAGGKDD